MFSNNIKINILYILMISIQTSLEENITNNGGKSYFFKMGKNTNEFRLNNKIMYLNHNITDMEYPILEKKKVYPSYQTIEKFPKFDISYYIDEEWNYNHQNNINKSHLPIFVSKFYEQISATPDLTKTTRILFNINRNKSSPILMFQLESIDKKDNVQDADLYFYWPLKNTSLIYKESVVLRLYQFEKTNKEEINETYLIEYPDIHKLFNVIYVSKAQKGWQVFKVKKPIDNWLHGEQNLGLILTISRHDNNELIELFNDNNSGKFSTFIVVRSQNNETQSENKIVANENDTSLECKRLNWTINFRSMGWDKFIILPEEFNAFDCAGKCSTSVENETNHAKFLYIFQKRTTCCVPINYLPLPIMYFDKFENIVIKHYDKAIVKSCGCR